MMKPELKKSVYLFLPIIIWVLPYIIKVINVDIYKASYLGEFGITENLTILFLVFAVLVGTLSFFKALKFFSNPHYFHLRFVPWWILLITLGCLYFGGEEASWGQHFMGWGTPDFWQSINDQGETNLHNTSGLFDQVPRLILTTGALMGGIVFPLLLTIKNIKLEPSNSIYWVLPTIVCMPAAILAVFISHINELMKDIGNQLPFITQNLSINVGESKECFLGLFLLIYLISLMNRLRDLQK